VNIYDYLIDQTGLDWQSLLAEWYWLLPPEFRVWMFTRTGDLFITVPDGSIHMLDVGAGTLKQVAENRDEFCSKMDEAGVADDWLMIPVVDHLVASNIGLGPGQCYSFRQLPVFGGTYRPENRMAFPIREHFGAWGSVHRQIADLPDGAEVVIRLASFIAVRWLHSNPHEPIELFSELDSERRERRKVELFADGRLQYADARSNAMLGLIPVPPLDEIAADAQFVPRVISAEEFEAVWAAAHKGT
jgi:hypothetical protein